MRPQVPNRGKFGNRRCDNIAVPQLPNKSNAGKQARIALKRLSQLGLYKGDLRKRPTKYALKKIDQFGAVLAGKATVVTPKSPERFKNIFDVVGDKVIVPRRKGERITIDKKTREIVSRRKVGKRTIEARGMQIKRGEKPPQTEYSATYAVPLKATGGVIAWHRFPDRQMLINFMSTYDFLGWENYVVEERVIEIDDEELTERLENMRKGGRIRGNVKWTREERDQIHQNYRDLISSQTYKNRRRKITGNPNKGKRRKPRAKK